MPDYPVFQPAAAPGSGMTSALAGLDAGQSYMDRASQMRMAQETHRIQTQSDLDKIATGVIHAKNLADVAEAKNKIAAAMQTEVMRATAHDEMPQLRDEWAKASQVDDPIERADAQNSVLGRATKYQSVAELAPEISAWKNVWANSSVTARTLLNSHLASERQADKSAAEIEKQRIRDEAAAQRAGDAQSHARDLADSKAENDRLRQQLANQGKIDVVRTRGDETRQTVEATGRGLTTVEKYERKRNAARDAGNGEAETLYDELIRKAKALPVGTVEGSELVHTKLEEAQTNANDPDALPEEKQLWLGRVKFWQERSTALNRRGVKQESATDALLRQVTTPSSASAAPAAAQPASGDWQEIQLPNGQKFKIRKKG